MSDANEQSDRRKKKPGHLLAEELLLGQKLSAVSLDANFLVPLNKRLLDEAVVEARNLYLYASKQKDRDPAKTRYLLAKMTALCVARDVLYPEK